MTRPRILAGRARLLLARIAAALLASSGLFAEASPLPDPLTLAEALRIAEETPHPDLRQAQAQLELAQAGLAGAEARNRPNLSAEGRLRWVEPSDIAIDQDRHDHQAALRLRQNLYDFGRTAALEKAAEADIGGRDALLRDAHLTRRLTVMRRFFDVLLADQAYARENESMAVAYVDLDKLRARRQLDQISELTLLSAESAYQSTRVRRKAAEGEMRAARLRLALALGQPEAMPGNLAQPELPQIQRELPDEARLLAKALTDNPTLAGIRGRVEGARQRMAAARAEGRPRLEAEFELAAYHREMGSYDPARAGVVLNIPLFTGGAVDAAVARELAEVHRLEGEQQQVEYAVRQRLLDLALRLQTLKLQADAVKVERDYRELYLDRSRAVYEMELKTDLGDAMVKLTEAQLGQIKRDFEAALAWEELDAVTGGPLPPEGPTENGGRK